ncbi:phytanoyl-CoA dioxygenase family protein [Elysia marginata]|uniref:Phytanoyl-CoA dioxygenase family protein n=1 Tax=Elysia marginata TaxID=1093978 RepID=A0AAV4IIZ4_9GAST|nr:phytanoyl-CoA dioxygenase family protein [Elysia marginata]
MSTIKDWSLEHKPSGKLFQPVQNKAEWAKHKLTDKQIDTFWQDGFLNHVPLLSAGQCDAIMDEYGVFMVS